MGLETLVARIIDSKEESLDARVRFLVVAWLFAPSLGIVSGLIFALLGHTNVLPSLIGLSCAVPLLVLLYRRTKRFSLCAHLSVAVGVACLMSSALGEETLEPGVMVWFAILPTVSILIIDWKASISWLAVSSACLTYLWYAMPPPTPDSFGLVFLLRIISFLVTVFGITVLFDLSRNRALEGEQAANRAKSAFLAAMSHEIRTPMNGVLGMTEVMLLDPLRDEQREQLTVIQRCGNMLVALINDLLDFSKNEAGQLTLSSLPFALRPVLTDLQRLHEVVANAKGVKLVLALAEDVPEGVSGDALRLRQVLSNLLGNAVKFTPQGEVRLEVSCQSGELLRFAVRDTGIGIAPEAHGRIFEPFQQADDSTTRRFGGTGLGLSLSKQLVRAMGSTLTLASSPGVGSCFSFDVKLPRADVKPAEVTHELMSTDERLPVLIVDDNPINLSIAAALVRRYGYEAHLAENGARRSNCCTSAASVSS